MSLTSKYISTLCLIVVNKDSEENSIYLPVTDFLFANGFIPVEVRSPGEALIQTRQANFFLVIISDDDHDLIKKIKSKEGLNSDTIVIAVSSTEDIKDSTQELFDANIIQHVVCKSTDLDQFRSSVIEVIKPHLPNKENREKDEQSHMMQNTQSNQSFQTQDSIQSEPVPSYKISSPSYLNNMVSSQTNKPECAHLQQAYYGSNPMQPPHPSSQPYPMQPFTLFPPILVPYHSLVHPSSMPADAYMMPRIVDFGAAHDSLAGQIHGTIPGYSDCSTINTASLKQDSTHSDITNNNVPGTESTRVNTSQNISQSQDKLPDFEKFLECLSPEPKHCHEAIESEDGNPREHLKRPRLDSTTCDGDTVSSSLEDIEEKNPLSTLQTRPYFMNLDEQIEDMAFDPNVKASDRHNAKERHRRIRITKATEFFKETIPGMDTRQGTRGPSKDKVTILNLTVYYMVFLRNALHRMDPTIVQKLHKSYKEEWKPYFEKQTTIQPIE